MNATPTASLLSAVELAPRDPILGVTEAFNADTESAQGQPRRRRLLRRQRQAAAARVRQARRAQLAEKRRAARLPADRRHRAYDQAVQALVFGADSAPIAAGRVVTVQALGGTGGAQGRRRLPASASPRRAGLDQRSELGEPPRAVRRRRLRPSTPTRTTTPRRGGLDFDGMLAALERAARRARSSCCMRAATTRPAST